MSSKAFRMGWRTVCGLLLAGVLTGCSCGKPWHRSDDSVPVDAGIDIIRVGEQILVSLTDMSTPPAPIEQRVREDGKITLWFTEEFQAAGRRVADLQEDIRKRYLKTYFQRLTVSVRIEGRIITVGGYVRSPGRYNYQGEMTVLDAIKVAGDFNEFARRSCVRVTRSNGEEIIANCSKALKDPDYDPPLYPGDDVYVPKKTW